MKRLLLLVTLLFTIQGVIAQNTWTQKTAFPGTARNYAVSFSIGTKGYIGTGSDGTNKKDFWEYDPASNTWTQKADFGGTARNSAVGFSIGTKGYIGTGYDGSGKKDFWAYDPSDNTWTPKTDFGGAARFNAVGFGIGTKGYIGTGTAGIYTKDFWEYDPATDTWTQKSDFGGVARDGAVGFGIGTKGYIGTGYVNFGNYKKDIWEYDPSIGTLGTWTQKTDFGGTGRYIAIGFSTDTKGYIGTGLDPGNKNDFWEYDPSGDSWVQKADFGGTGRYSALGFSIGTKGYVGTGFDGSYRDDFWEYAPTISPTCPSTYTLSATTPSVNATTGSWIAPPTGGPYVIQIKAAGAQGGSSTSNAGGKGAVMTGNFTINAGQSIDIIAGAQGGSGGAGGGGGGSGARMQNGSILIVAGGGGGGGVVSDATSDGNISVNGGNGGGSYGGQGGVNGNGGNGGASSPIFGSFTNPGGGGGGGALSAGSAGGGYYSGQPTSGGAGGGGGFGGMGGNSTNGTVSGGGGFGGGGQAASAWPGGGGGYSGGGGAGGSSNYSGGGGSYNTGTNPANTAGANTGGGYVTIQCLGPVNQPTTTTIASSLNPSCPASNVTFTATVLINGNAGTPATTGTVTFTEGTTVVADNVALNADGQAAFSTDALGAGTHTILATYNASAGFITSNGSINQVVNARPTASISGGATYCSGSNTETILTINATANGITRGTLSDGTPFSGTGPTTTIHVTVIPTATTSYTIATLSDVNCTAQVSDLSGTATVTVNPLPVVSFGGLASSYCINADAVTLTGNPASGTFSGTGISDNSFDPATAGVGGPYTITYYYTDGNGCSDASSQQVTVNAAATAMISGTTAVCVSAPSPNITFTGSGGTAPYTFTYTINDAATQMVTTSAGSSVTVAAPTGSIGTSTYKLLSVSDASSSQCTQAISGQTATVTVNALPTATISGGTSVCQNSAAPHVTLSGSGGTAPYTFTYTVSENGATPVTYTATGNPATINVSTTTPSNYMYILTNVQDASSTSCSQPITGQSAVATINPLPNATITTESMVTAASTGNVASVTDAGTSATYAWTISNGTITAGNGTNSITYKAGNAGSVTLGVSVTSGSNCGPVSGIAQVPITALACPNPAITVATSVCSLSAGNIASVANAGTGATYVWTITNGTITGGSGTRQVTFTAGNNKIADYGADDYISLSVKVTNPGGACTVSSGNYRVCIIPIPLATISTATAVCSLSPGNIASVPHCGTGATYSWSISNGTITSGAGTKMITYTAGASGSVTLSVIVSNKGCTASSGNKQVTISGLPVAVITAPAAVCSGSCGNTASVATGSGSKYLWTIKNGSINSGCNANKITFSAGTSGSVTLTVTVINSGGCKTFSGNRPVTIITLPNPAITASSPVCAGSTSNTASVPSAGNGASYAWTISGGTITSGGGTNNVKYTAGTSGYVTLGVTISNSNGCKKSGSKKIAISAKVVPAFTQVAALCKNAKAPSLPAKSNNGITGTWSPSKVSTSSVTTTTYTFTPAPGQCATSTTMKITVKNCSGLSSVNIIAGNQVIAREPLMLEAVILPNPSQAHFNLIIKGNRTEVAHIIVSDILGRNIEDFKAGAGSSVRFGDNYAHGTYIVQVLQGTERRVLKAIKQ